MDSRENTDTNDLEPTSDTHNPLVSLGYWLSVWFGSGLLPKAPGTWGSAAAIGLFALWFPNETWATALGFILLCIIGTWAIHTAMPVFGKHDPGQIVIDEVAGVYLVWWFIRPDTFAQMAVVFTAFRVFDVIKPPPIKQLDARVGGAVGVMLDDLVAGFFAAGALWGLQQMVGWP